MFLVNLSGRRSPLPQRSLAKFCSIMGEVVTCLISGLSVGFYSHMLAFFRISELLSIRRSNIVTEDLYHKIFIEVSKTDKYREGSWVYIAKTGKFYLPLYMPY